MDDAVVYFFGVFWVDKSIGIGINIFPDKRNAGGAPVRNFVKSKKYVLPSSDYFSMVHLTTTYP